MMGQTRPSEKGHPLNKMKNPGISSQANLMDHDRGMTPIKHMNVKLTATSSNQQISRAKDRNALFEMQPHFSTASQASPSRLPKTKTRKGHAYGENHKMLTK